MKVSRYSNSNVWSQNTADGIYQLKGFKMKIWYRHKHLRIYVWWPVAGEDIQNCQLRYFGISSTPISCHRFFSIPTQNVKKNMFSDVSRGFKTTSVMKMVTEPNTNTKKTQNVNIKIKQIWRNFFQVKTQIVIKRNESYKVLLLSFFWLWVGWTCFFFHSISSMQWHIKNQQQGRISLFKVSDQDMWTPSFSHYMETSQLIQATDRFLYNRELCGRSMLMLTLDKFSMTLVLTRP